MNSSEEEIFTTIEEISVAFNPILSACITIEEANIDASIALTILKKIELSIKKLSLFSPNEEVDDILTENLKYMLLPFCNACISYQISANRKEKIIQAKKYFEMYLSLMAHYKILPKEYNNYVKTIIDNEPLAFGREEKIALYKQGKELKVQIEVFFGLMKEPRKNQ